MPSDSAENRSCSRGGKSTLGFGLWTLDFPLQIHHQNFFRKTLAEREDFAAAHSSATLWPSKINSSFAPTALTCASGIFSSRATRRSISSRVRSLPSCHGDAEMFRMISAPCAISSFTGSRRYKPLRPEILVVPDVLANRDAELAAVEHERLDVFGRFKITVFVKNIVGRQQAFGRAPDDFPVLQNGGGILQRAAGPFGISVHKADAERNRADFAGGFRQRGEIGLDEIVAQQQIARRVAAEKQFRREDKFRAARDGLRVGGQQFLAVGREVADGRIELEQADFQSPKV